MCEESCPTGGCYVEFVPAANNIIWENAIENTAVLAQDCSKENLKSTLEQIRKSDKSDPIKLVENVKNKEREKFDHFLPKELLDIEYHKRFISMEKTYRYIASLHNI